MVAGIEEHEQHIEEEEQEGVVEKHDGEQRQVDDGVGIDKHGGGGGERLHGEGVAEEQRGDGLVLLLLLVGRHLEQRGCRRAARASGAAAGGRAWRGAATAAGAWWCGCCWLARGNDCWWCCSWDGVLAVGDELVLGLLDCIVCDPNPRMSLMDGYQLLEIV